MINQVEVEGQRFYLVDGVAYPSVTRVLKDSKEFNLGKAMNRWEAKLEDLYGYQKAQNKLILPKKIGSFVHAEIEHYLLNFDEKRLKNSIAIRLLPVFNQIHTVHHVEYPVCSKRWGYAGTIDAVVSFRDDPFTLVLLDWKTTATKKSYSSILDYRLQVAAYAKAFEEQTGKVIGSGQINVLYRQPVGVRKPTYYDEFEVDTQRKDWDLFEQRLKIFQQIEHQKQLLESF